MSMFPAQTAQPAIPAKPRIPESAPLEAPTVNQGLAATTVPAQQGPDPLRDPELLKRAALDHRGSRQVAPFGTWEAVGAALSDGYYTGLEALDFGTLPDGTPAALFTDQNGQRQAIRMSTEQWTAALQQRAQARMSMAQKMRIAEDGKRLGPAIQQMAKTVDTVVPGYSDYAALLTEQDPMGAFSSVQRASEVVQNRDRAKIDALAKETNAFRTEVNHTRAQKWMETQMQEAQDAAQGFLSDPSIPELDRQMKAGNVYRNMEHFRYFAGYVAPAEIGSQVSFPTFFTSMNPDIGALEDLVDMSMAMLGPTNLASYPVEQQTWFMVQKAQEAARNVGWTVPFSKMDIDNLSAVYQRKMGLRNPQQIIGQQPTQPQPSPEYTQAQQRGQGARFRAAEAEARRASEMKQIEMSKARAEAERTQAGVESTMSETAIMRGEQPMTGPLAEQYRIDAFKQSIRSAGIPFEDTGNLEADMLRTTQELAKDRSPEGRALMQRWVDILQSMKPQKLVPPTPAK